MLTKYRLFLALTLVAASAVAGPAPELKQTSVAPPEMPARDIFAATVEQTFQSDFKSGFKPGAENATGDNDTNTWHYRFAYNHRVPVNDRWFVRGGLDVGRFDFGDNRSIAPNTLQSYAAVFALEYFVEGHVGFFIETKPGLYFSHDLAGSSFDAPTTIVAAYPLVEKKLFLVGGVSLSLLRSYPVLPGGGVIWNIDDKWDLHACAPSPRLSYSYSRALKFWAGGEMVGGAYRADSSDIPELNGTAVSYYELRAGGGFTFLGWNRFTIDFGGGWAFKRKFDYHRADRSAETYGAPYVRLTANAAF